MVVSESGLMAAMKKAYKKEGYKVAGLHRAGFEELLIGTEDWVTVMAKKNVPRKVLGLIAEHLGQIPGEGEAFQVAQDAPQTEIFHVALQLLEGMDNQDRQWRQAKPTAITMGGKRLWQREGDMQVLRVSPALEDIMLHHGRRVMMFDDERLMVDGNASRVYISVCETKATEEELLKHLGKVQWVSFEKEK